VTKEHRFKNTLASCFACAIRGLATLVSSQRNARIHLLATVLVLAAGAFLRLDRTDWCWIVVAIALPWAAEALNTAIELLGDAISTERNPLIGSAKDIAAAGVLAAAIGAAAIGLLVLGPRILERF
jgi:diacylglycerol kinase